MPIAANDNWPCYGLFVIVHPCSGTWCLCHRDLRVLLDHCDGRGGDFWLGRKEVSTTSVDIRKGERI